MRTSRERRRAKILSIGLLFLFAGFLCSGCHKTVRVPVSEADILRANEVALEGDAAFARKDFYAALIKYLESVRLNPNNEYVYNKLGISYSQLKYYEQAADSFERSIELNPKYPFSYNNLGSVLFAVKNLKKAEKYFKKAISLKADEASFHMNLGSLHMERKRRDKAMAEWRKGLALDPNILSRSSAVSLVGGSTSTMERHYVMARLLASIGNVEAAIESLKKAIAEGFTDIESVRKEPDFDRIREDKSFIDFIDDTALLIRLRSNVGLPETD